jgi:hypothetical protein
MVERFDVLEEARRYSLFLIDIDRTCRFMIVIRDRSRCGEKLKEMVDLRWRMDSDS